MSDLAAVLDKALGLGLESDPRLFRTNIARGLAVQPEEPAVDRDEGIIYGYSVITKGPALGHDMEIDQTTLEQVVALGNRTKQGIKTRFDHPNASSTSMGTFLGRSREFRLAGDRVLADLYLSASAKEAPQGDLYTYVLGLAERDPAAFGASIVFEGKAEYQLEPDGTRKKDEDGKPLPRLARVEKLLASDVVDDPAANPGGLFHAGDSLAAKVTAFLNRWAQHDLLPQLSAALAGHKEERMSDTNVITTAQVDAARADGHAAGVKAERERVAAIHKACSTVWGANPPAAEITVRDGLIELGVSAADAETEFKKRKLTQLTVAAPASAGGADDRQAETKPDLSKLSIEDRAKAEWESNAGGVRDEFQSLGAYTAFLKAEAAGSVKILKK